MTIQGLVDSRSSDHARELLRIGAVLQDGAEHLTGMLEGHVLVIGQPLPMPGKPDTMARALMIRECIDLAAREWAGAATFLQQNEIATARTTENQRRKQIIPATPSCLRLKETAIEGRKVLDTVAAVAWTKDDVSSDELSTLLGAEAAEKFLSGRPVLVGAASAQAQIDQVLLAIARLESHWGSFDIWVKRRESAAISSLGRALVKGEPDHEEFLDELIRELDDVHAYANKSPEEASRYLSLKRWIAATLWNNGRGPKREYTRLEDLKRHAFELFSAMNRVRPIELDDNPVLPLEAVEKRSTRLTDEDTGIATRMIEALGPQKIDQAYLHLRLVEEMPPREIQKELSERFGKMSDEEFKNLQHRCNRQVKLAKRFVNTTQPATRRSRRDAILKLIASKKAN